MINRKMYNRLGAAATIVAAASAAASFLAAPRLGPVYIAYGVAWLLLALLDYYVWRHPPMERNGSVTGSDVCGALRELAELAAIISVLGEGGGDPVLAYRAASIVDKMDGLRSVVGGACGEAAAHLDNVLAGDRGGALDRLLRALAECMDRYGCEKNIVIDGDG